MGVKQLWTLLGPAGRPVLLETMEGKTMAIDSSIWIYQFQATMRDKDGRALVNAHVLGFLRRICKLLFYGIKPVFVFDGGAPLLKRTTLIERKRKKAGAADSHVKVAEKLLAAQMRREAIAHVQDRKGQKSASTDEPQIIVDENTVYLEDLENNTANAPNKTTPIKSRGEQSEKHPGSSKKKARFHDHDPYRLPEVDPSSISQPTSSLAPDPRLATEEELRVFIESMRPEDFDVTSPAFRELPTEVQYEIIGDLRLKSRQTSHKRLQSMLRAAATPLDFSKAQIRNLQQRNTLTQQLLETTDSISKAHVSIPVRIASERNKEYILVKNDGEDGGWVLGIQDEGTLAKPIVIDDAGEKQQSDSEEESETEMEEVAIPGVATPDLDLREYRGRMALASVPKRNDKSFAGPPRQSGSKASSRPNKTPLFMEEDDDVENLDSAIQESLLQQENDDLQQAISASLVETQDSIIEVNPPTARSENSDDDDLYTPSRLDTALSFANTPSSKRSLSNPQSSSPLFSKRASLLSEDISASERRTPDKLEEDSEDDMEEIIVEQSNMSRTAPANSASSASSVVKDIDITPNLPPAKIHSPVKDVPGDPSQSSKNTIDDDSLDDLYVDVNEVVQRSLPSTRNDRPRPTQNVSTTGSSDPSPGSFAEAARDATKPEIPLAFPAEDDVLDGPRAQRVVQDATEVPDEEQFSDWEQSSSTVGERVTQAAATSQPAQHETEDWDAVQEMDVAAEEGDFAQLLSQMKGRDLDTVRRDIDEEIRELHKQKKVAMRDSEDITQHMISQIMMMLRLFGIPYITAPMEAEAQCAALVSLGLVDGVITDDSDAFLFGALRVYKNMFNQSKTIESFFLSELSRELGLERDKLIRLAYLLGSDYVEGLPGVGPVVAMELLKEFPGEDGLHKFRQWWRKVQSGKDSGVDTNSKFRRRFKKRFKDLYLPDDWPNPAVRDAYYHPAVDESDEEFKWGLPDLDALRDFFRQELGWHQDKVDDLLLPIIRKMGQRGQAAAANRQGTLDGFFNVTLENGTFAPRRRQAYSSKRLQEVISDFRAERKKVNDGVASGQGIEKRGTDAEEGPPKKKRRGKETSEASKKSSAKRKPRDSQRGAGRKRKAAAPSRGDNDAEDEPERSAVEGLETPPPAPTVKLRPRHNRTRRSVSAVDEGGEEVSDDSDEEFILK